MKTLREKLKAISDFVASAKNTAALVVLGKLNLTLLKDATRLVEEETPGDTTGGFQSGAVPDTRSDAEKAGDYQFHEIVAGAEPVNWVYKPQSDWRKFPITSQNGSSSCVAHTEAKELGIIRFMADGNFVSFSASDIFQRRSNKPGWGMAAADARSIVKTGGATLEVLAPSQNMTDAQMDKMPIEPYKREVGAVFAVPEAIELQTKDIDAIASVIQRTQKGVMVWFYFRYDEWNERPTVKQTNLDLQGSGTLRHSVTAVDFTLLEDGKKALIIEDSWGPNMGLNGQRVIDEDFFKKRNWFAGYLMSFKFDSRDVNKPKYTFKVDLKHGQRNKDIVALQDCLKYDGTYPTNIVSTGFYGAITNRAVHGFQSKYGLVNGDQVGEQTRQKLNQLFGV